MSHIKILIILLFPCFILTSSCETEAKNVKLPDYELKLVVSAFISPTDSISEINVGTTHRIFGNISEQESAGNLQAFVSDGTSEISAARTSSGFMFTPDEMKIREGHTYNIKVLSDKGMSAKASCTVPEAVNFHIQADTMTLLLLQEGIYFPVSRADISITDIPGAENFFRLVCVQVIYGAPYYDPVTAIRLTDLQGNLFTDKGRDGKKFFLKSVELMQFPMQDSAFLKVYVFNTDKDYYDFHNSFLNYSGGENPFRENSPLYSNVEGGIGIFSAYTVDSLIFRLK